jgi:hypothetical protein
LKNKHNQQILTQTNQKKGGEDQIHKIRAAKRMSQHTSVKFKGSLGNTLETYIPINWKI